MPERITNAVLAERIQGIKNDTGRILEHQEKYEEKTNGRLFDHQGRLSSLEGKWGLLVKIVLPAAGVAGVGGTVAKLTGLF